MNGVLESLRRFQFAQTAAFRRASDALGIPETALDALRSLVADADEEGVSMKDLAHSVGVSPAVLTGIVDKLEEKGWVRRQLHSTDRRSTVVVPTVEEGGEVLAVLRALDEPLRKVANSLPRDVAAMVKSFAGAMEAEMRNFTPDAVSEDRSS